MKRIFAIISALALSLGVFSSCNFEYEYYEPAFYDDTIDWTISAFGGDYPIQYKFVPFDETKTINREFDFVYRLIIDGVAGPATEPKDVIRDYDDHGDRIYTFYVTIPENNTGHPRAILIEASTHIDVEEQDDYWSDWFPVISTVQNY